MSSSQRFAPSMSKDEKTANQTPEPTSGLRPAAAHL
jgi:hypothetical protein